MSRELVALKRILDLNKSFHIEFCGFFSNHLSHGAISLYLLGASAARMDSFAERYCQRLEPPIATPASPPASDSPQELQEQQQKQPPLSSVPVLSPGSLISDEAGWRALLGRRTRYRELVSYFRHRLRGPECGGSTARLLWQCYPALAPGMSGSALHPHIHIGWGLSVMTNAPLHAEDMVCQGLAYATHSFVSLRDPSVIRRRLALANNNSSSSSSSTANNSKPALITPAFPGARGLAGSLTGTRNSLPITQVLRLLLAHFTAAEVGVTAPDQVAAVGTPSLVTAKFPSTAPTANPSLTERVESKALPYAALNVGGFQAKMALLASEYQAPLAALADAIRLPGGRRGARGEAKEGEEGEEREGAGAWLYTAQERRACEAVVTKLCVLLFATSGSSFFMLHGVTLWASLRSVLAQLESGAAEEQRAKSRGRGEGQRREEEEGGGGERGRRCALSAEQDGQVSFVWESVVRDYLLTLLAAFVALEVPGKRHPVLRQWLLHPQQRAEGQGEEGWAALRLGAVLFGQAAHANTQRLPSWEAIVAAALHASVEDEHSYKLCQVLRDDYHRLQARLQTLREAAGEGGKGDRLGGGGVEVEEMCVLLQATAAQHAGLLEGHAPQPPPHSSPASTASRASPPSATAPSQQYLSRFKDLRKA